jgi:hypothetical protein
MTPYEIKHHKKIEKKNRTPNRQNNRKIALRA